MTHAVLLEEYRPVPSPLLMAILEQQLKMPRQMAAKLSKTPSGHPIENVPEPQAKLIAEAITAGGHPARVIPQNQVVPATTPRRVHVLDLDGEMLGIQLRYSGAPEWVRWDDVLVLSCGAIRTETTKKEVVETAIARMGTITQEIYHTDITRNLLLEMFAVAAQSKQLLHVRLQCHEVNYAKTLGGTIHESWREKFAVLVAKLGLKSNNALISPQTEAMLAAGMVPASCQVNPYFDTEQDFVAYNRWLLNRQRLGLGA